jgi:hypothetical protein
VGAVGTYERKEYTILTGKLEKGKRFLGDLRVDGRIILKLIFKLRV